MRLNRSGALRGRNPVWWVVLTALLVLSLGGTGYAAKRYIITSTKQISPKVVKKLKGKAGRQGPRGAQGAQGLQGVQGLQGAQGRPGTARASAQVATGINPFYDANQGFPGEPRRLSTGIYCVPAPSGVDPDNTAVLVGLSGGSIGFVTQTGPPSAGCRPNEFEIATRDPSGVLVDGNPFFNIIVP
jgi:hypothetical protein